MMTMPGNDTFGDLFPDTDAGETASPKKPSPPNDEHGYPATRFASVALVVPTPKPYLYAIPDEWDTVPAPGCRVFVPQRKSTKIGYVIETGSRRLVEREGIDPKKIKPLIGVKDSAPLVSPMLLKLARFMSAYYRCGLGETIEAMLPSGVRTGSKQLRLKMVIPSVDSDRLELEASRREKKAPKQAALLRTLAALTPPVQFGELLDAANANAQSLKTLEKHGLLGIHDEIPTDELITPPPGQTTAVTHTDAQRHAVDSIAHSLTRARYATFLLEGVTGSGKTEVYLEALGVCVKAGRSGIVLVPEISLTPQTVTRFRSRFKRVAVLHSHLTGGQRADQWRAIANGDIDVVIGARAAIFAPLKNLGLIIIDEEHETSFKQDNAPRYHARDVAIVRAAQANATVVLGSATPSMESWFNARTGKYSHLLLPKRVTAQPLPSVRIIDMTRDNMTRSYLKTGLTDDSVNALKDTLAEGHQAIFFLNRRGHNTALRCPHCGWVDRCDACAVARTYHKSSGVLLCHYCGSTAAPPSRCPACGHDTLVYLGTGTERVQNALKALVPAAVVERMDSDTMTQRGAYARILAAFRRREVDVLVGTQMIAKGLDFPNVTLVVIVNADIALDFPDFRASERTFQLISQVAGRAGRGEDPGHVIVQTHHPRHPAIRYAAMHDFPAFAAIELEARRALFYPPYSRMTRIIWRGENPVKVSASSDTATRVMRDAAKASGSHLIFKGPVDCPIERIQNKRRKHLLILSPGGRRPLLTVLNAARKELSGTKSVQIAVDMDPQNML